MEKGDILCNYAPLGRLDAYRRGVTLNYFLGGENGKNLEIVWIVSMHYLINAKVEKGDMLPNDAHWGGLDAY